jgi:hypothetical protein
MPTAPAAAENSLCTGRTTKEFTTAPPITNTPPFQIYLPNQS